MEIKALITIILISTNYAIAQTESIADVRNVNWGMSIEQVKAKEKVGTIKDATLDNMLVYKADVLGFPAEVLYNFQDKQLFEVYFFFQINNVSKNKYVEDYNQIKKALDKKFGYELTFERWRDSLFYYEPDKIGVALWAQHVEFYTYYGNERTGVALGMNQKDNEIFIFIKYNSKDIIRKEEIRTEDI